MDDVECMAKRGVAGMVRCEEVLAAGSGPIDCRLTSCDRTGIQLRTPNAVVPQPSV